MSTISVLLLSRPNAGRRRKDKMRLTVSGILKLAMLALLLLCAEFAGAQSYTSVQKGYTINAASNTSHTCTLSSTVTVGNVVTIPVIWGTTGRGIGTVSDDLGNTWNVDAAAINVGAVAIGFVSSKAHHWRRIHDRHRERDGVAAAAAAPCSARNGAPRRAGLLRFSMWQEARPARQGRPWTPARSPPRRRMT